MADAIDGATDARIADEVERILVELSLEEKVHMLSGHGFFDEMRSGGRYCETPYRIGGGNERLGVPYLRFSDGPRGVVTGHSTCFPVSMARGASFDVELERRIGDAIGRELRAQGANLYGGVCINLLRHPAWGRAQETYGEDPHLLGAMGAALVRGVQHHNVVATAKHYAANSMENARFTVDVRIGDRALREVYVPHFKACVDAGCGAVMSAYNRVNGAYCGHSSELLRTLLRDELGFDGIVYSDFVMGCRGADALTAGLDVEAPDTVHYGQKLVDAVRAGEVAPGDVDDAVRRVLRTLYRALARPDPESYPTDVVAGPEHRALAREASEASIVLLENDGLLPLDAASLARLAVVGRLAAEPNLGDRGSSHVYPPSVVTPLAGLETALGGACDVLHDDGTDPARAAALAARCDAVLVVAGYTHRDEGEFIPGGIALEGGADGEAPSIGGDRDALTLSDADEALILAVAAANPRTAVAVMAGSAVIVERWRERVGALLLLWYPGMEGGAALANVLLGRANPSAKLPFSVPRDASHLPFFDKTAERIEYDLYHGYTKLERDGVEPRYAFGEGRSYTRFAFADARARVTGDAVDVSVRVRNTGSRRGAEIAQLYVGFDHSRIDRPRKLLRGFRKVALDPGEERLVSFRLERADLAYYDETTGAWRVEDVPHTALVGGSSRSADLLGATFEPKLLPDASAATGPSRQHAR